jgi:hypothetical protein
MPSSDLDQHSLSFSSEKQDTTISFSLYLSSKRRRERNQRETEERERRVGNRDLKSTGSHSHPI